MGRTLDQIIQNEKPTVVAEAKAKAQKILRGLDKYGNSGTDATGPDDEPVGPANSSN